MSLHDQKIELLRKLDLFSELREYELDVIAQYRDFISLPGRASIQPGRPFGGAVRSGQRQDRHRGHR